MAIEQQELDAIQPTDWWVALKPMMQKHWALIESNRQGTYLYFVDDLGGVFDRLSCKDTALAIARLQELGFQPYADNPRLRRFLRAPERPLSCETIRERPIYSGGVDAAGTARLK